MKIKIKKDDNVIVISGKDKGKSGKVIQVYPKTNRVSIEGVNLYKKHIKPKTEEEKGQIIEVARPINISNVKIICKSCGSHTRIGIKIKDGNKVRICKKCGAEL